MGRHRVVNPKTGRRVFKTGAIGKKIAKTKGESASTKKKASTHKKPRCTSSKKCYAGPGATKRQSPLLKTTKSGIRPSARAMYDRGELGPVFYDGSCHVMAFRVNGSPYWKRM